MLAALKKAGAASVLGLTVARVVPGSSLKASQQCELKIARRVKPAGCGEHP